MLSSLLVRSPLFSLLVWFGSSLVTTDPTAGHGGLLIGDGPSFAGLDGLLVVRFVVSVKFVVGDVFSSFASCKGVIVVTAP